jgi:transcriptional regulator
MYVPSHFALPDAGLRAFLRGHVFATIAGVIGGAIQFAYAPVVYDETCGPRGGVRFHLARANPLSGLQEGAPVKLSIMGPHAYVSPDWYETRDLVPTWNYIAAEGEGHLVYLDDDGLSRLLDDLTQQEESLLTPKPPWTRARMDDAAFRRMRVAIAGFALPFEVLEGKIKLSQNRAGADIAGVIANLEKRGDAASLAVAAAMRIDSLS